MRIATWNINGIKARFAELLHWLKQTQPDIVCLQEIKSVDAQFPRGDIENLGYYVETHGQKSFNGVALLSKKQPEDVKRGLLLPGKKEDEQARFIEAVYSFEKKAIRVASLYLPNGNPVWPEGEKNADGPFTDKYRYKLCWMDGLYDFASKRLLLEEELILAGDYNVIPSEQDVARPGQWRQDALFLPDIRQHFYRLLNLGLTDALRAVSDEKVYTFWDYQAGALAKNNGIRIDHILLSPEAADRLTCASIDKEMRGRNKPSDHAPVWVELGE